MRRFVKSTIVLLALMFGVHCAPGVCRAEEDLETVPVYGEDIRDGSYEVEVESSSSMFRVVKAVLTVSDGNMTMDMTLSGTGYLKLFMGTGEEALESGEENFIPFVEDDEGKYTYTIPVEAVGQEFDCAAFSKRKQKWYDRQLIIPASSLPEEALLEAGSEEPEQPPAEKREPDGDGKQPAEKQEPDRDSRLPAEKQEPDGDGKLPVEIQEPDGDYTMEVTLNGGTGRATVASTARITISEGKATACIEWSSPDYDYMLVNGTQYFPVNEEGNSVFEIPVTALDEEMDVAADTVAMSQPHEIEYTLTFHSDTLQKAQGENGRPVAALLCIIAVLVLAAVCGCYVWKRHGRKAKDLLFNVFLLVVMICSIMFVLAGCGNTPDADEKNTNKVLQERNTDISPHLVCQESMELEYADQFAVDYYEGGYALISMTDGRRYLAVPEGKSTPEKLEKDIIVLKRPVTDVYLVATAVMDMFCELDALDSIRFSGQKADGWSRIEAREAMERGEIFYAGKYSAPDYETIVSRGCSLAIENNMITHSPEVVEKLGEFGIPVLIDLSSYESHPLGRAEWIRMYGVLLGKEEEAEEVFARQAQILKEVSAGVPSGKTAAYFFITANGMVNVRVSSDYVPRMIELAGGKYIFEDLEREDSHRSSVAMQMEEFYLAARDADYLIYNSTIEGGISSVQELLEMESLLGDFKAVKEGNVWCTTRDLYQQSMSIGQMIGDFYHMLSGEPKQQENIRYMYHLE